MYAQELVQKYSEVRARLYGKPQRQLPPPEPEPDLQQTLWPVIEEVEYAAPLDMLKPPSWRFLLALAAVRHQQSTRDILGYSRTRKIAIARHEAVYLIAFHTPHSIARMGTFFNRDHTTLLASLKKFPYIRRSNRPTSDREAKMGKDIITGLPVNASLLEIITLGYEQGIATEVIAKHAGVSSSVVRSQAFKIGLHHPNSYKYRTKAKMDWLVEAPEIEG
jgi:hypothetical protein